MPSFGALQHSKQLTQFLRVKYEAMSSVTTLFELVPVDPPHPAAAAGGSLRRNGGVKQLVQRVYKTLHLHS